MSYDVYSTACPLGWHCKRSCLLLVRLRSNRSIDPRKTLLIPREINNFLVKFSLNSVYLLFDQIIIPSCYSETY